MKLESEWFDENLIHCSCGFAFENWEDYVKHKKIGCVDVGVNQLIKDKIKAG